MSVTQFARLVLIAAAACFNSLAAPALGDNSTTSPRAAWLHGERARLQERLSGIRAREGRMEVTLTRALEVRSRAERIDDTEARRVAEEAVATARAALAGAKVARETYESSLAVLEEASKIDEECADLRTKAVRDREALRRQVGASQLIGQAGVEQSERVRARALIATAKLVKVPSGVHPVTRTLVEATELMQKLPASPVLLATAPDVKTLAMQWKALRAAAASDECLHELRALTSDSAFLEKGLAFGRCAESVHGLAEFFGAHGQVLDRLGAHLGIAVQSVDIANELRLLYEDLQSVKSYTDSYPTMALAAAKRLDELQKTRIAEIRGCEVRLDMVMQRLQ